MAFYYQDSEHPITQGVSNFDFDDEIYYDLHMMPEARILAASYAPDKRNTKEGRILPSVYEIVPQMWTYERTLEGGQPYRAFVSIPGHNHKTFSLPHYRAVLLRGIAWAAKRAKDSYYMAQFHRLRSRRGPQKAICAVAASILTAIYHMLKSGTPHRDLGADYFDRRSPEAKAKRLVTQLTKLGFDVKLQPLAVAA